MTINRAISGYLYDRSNGNREIKNEDVYSPLRLALTGYASGPSVGEIAEILTYEAFVSRVGGLVERLRSEEFKQK